MHFASFFRILSYLFRVFFRSCFIVSHFILFYKNQNLTCHSENIPTMLKGIAFNEESKSQPKRDGL